MSQDREISQADLDTTAAHIETEADAINTWIDVHRKRTGAITVALKTLRAAIGVTTVTRPHFPLTIPVKL